MLLPAHKTHSYRTAVCWSPVQGSRSGRVCSGSWCFWPPCLPSVVV